MTRAYNEGFIWRDLRLRGEKLLDSVRELWRSGRPVPRVAYAWPGGRLLDDEGAPVDFVTCLLPEGDVSAPLKKLAARTGAYAVLVVEPGPGGVTVLLESAHGTVRWTLGTSRLADRVVLGAAKAEDDVPGYGVLWQP